MSAVPSRVALLAEAIRATECIHTDAGYRDTPSDEEARLLAAAVERFVVEAEAQARTEGYEQAIADVHAAQDKAYRLAGGSDV